VLLAAVFVLAPLAGCGGKDGSSSGPSSTPATVTGLTVSPDTAMLKANQTVTFTATASMSSGSAQPVQPAWASDNMTVLSIDNAGLARGLSNGLATVTATHQGAVATRLMRVVTDYQGTWAGDYVLRACDHSGDFRSVVEFCDREEGFWPGDQLPLTLVATQDRDQATGQLALGEITGTMRGAIDDSGQLVGTAALTFSVEGAVITFNVPTLTVRADGDRLTGAFVVTVTAAGLSGQGYLEADLRSVARTAPLTAPAGHGSSRSFGSWRELLRAAQGGR
jgi:hypothetical protein